MVGGQGRIRTPTPVRRTASLEKSKGHRNAVISVLLTKENKLQSDPSVSVDLSSVEEVKTPDPGA